MSDIQDLRNQFKEIRSTLEPHKREEWEQYQEKLLELDTPPTPHEWVQQIKRMADEQRLENALAAWQMNRVKNPLGWGEDIDPSNHVEGWSEAKTPAHQAYLLETQLHEDLDLEWRYEEWRADRDW